jgi:membrane-bound serine protease (ClpP class)
MTRLCALLLLASLGGSAAAAETAIVIPADDVIGPATADFIERGLARAEEERASVAVIELDTPGGLDPSMRSIIKAILASPVPVVAYVAPSGARAASAGTYILYASHVAAMAPATNLGAATPVALGMPSTAPEEPDRGGQEPSGKASENGEAGGTGKAKRGPNAGEAPDTSDVMKRKEVSDAAAYIRGLAQARGRNAEWAEQAVREAASLSAEEALARGVIEIIATDLDDLLRRLDGRKIETSTGERELRTQGIVVNRIEPDWRTRVLEVITNPSIAYILLLIGIYGIVFEFYNPGFVMPGVAGAICLIVALFAFHLLPVNYAGLALLLLGIGFMVAEAFLPSFGALGVGGVVAFALGSTMLIDTGLPGFGIPALIIAAVTATSALLLFGLVGMAIKARRRPVVSGREALIGAVGEVLEDCAGEGWARVQGENWRVKSDAPLERGQKVRVTSMSGLVLSVTAE